MMDELVKRLRSCVDSLCGECKYQQLQKPGNFVPCMNAMITEAADAIERLAKDLERSKEWETFWEKEANEALKKFQVAIASTPRWIPATDKEHIPNTDHGVVGYFGGGAFNQLKWYDFVTTLSDGTIVGECTERDVMNEHCIAVYKLPPAPKEE